MKTKILLTLVLSALVFGYVPVPAPFPMGNYTVYVGQNVKGEFDIEDPNGPEGLSITVQPQGLNIALKEIVTIPTSQGGDGIAKRYTYSWTFQAIQTGLISFNITATDTLGIAKSQKIDFHVEGNSPHVFTGCRVLGN